MMARFAGCLLAIAAALSGCGQGAGDPPPATTGGESLRPAATAAERDAAKALSIASTGALDAQDEGARASECARALTRGVTLFEESGAVNEEQMAAIRQGRAIFRQRVNRLGLPEIADGEEASEGMSDAFAMRTSLACLNLLVRDSGAAPAQDAG